ncbi:MAG: extracellular solute-binding protein [Anaerolineales bacterium]
MKNRNRLFWLLTSMLILTLVFTACAQQPEDAEVDTPEEVVEEVAEEADPEPEQEKVTVEIWFEADDTGECMVEAVVNPFNEQSDTIFVEAVLQPESEGAQRTAMAGGAGPDIVDTSGPAFVAELVKADLLFALDDLAAEFGWNDHFVPWALSLGTVEGSLYSLTDELETVLLYYNKTVFEANGWELPTTIDELVALSETIDAAGIIPFADANADWRPANEWFIGEYLNHVAGPEKVYQALTGQIPWTDPDFVYAIELLNDAQQKGWFMGGLEFYYTTGWDDFNVALGTGEAAMSINGSWAAWELEDYYFIEETGGNEWDWVPFPSVIGDAIFDIGMGHTYSINAATEVPMEAGEFLNYLFSPEVQSTRFSECGLNPGPVKLPAGSLQGVDPRIGKIFEDLSASSDAGNYGYTTWTFFPPKTDTYLFEEIERVWAGEITPAEYMAGLDVVFQEEFDAGEVPPIPER